MPGKSSLYARYFAVACRYWQISPGRLRREIRRGEVLVSDVMELVRLLTHDPVIGPGIIAYVYPEVVRRRQQVRRNVVNNQSLAAILPMVQPKNEREAAFLEALDRELRGKR